MAALILGGCAGSSGGSSGGKLDVVATTTQIGDWARAVGGDAVDVHQILKPNSDPHEYEPRPGDVQATSGAAVVFTNGDELDSWAKKLIDQAGGKPRTVDLGAGVPVRLPGERSGPEASRYDPHWWHDARNAVAAVEQIRDALVSAAPSRRGTIERNAGRYLSKLRALDRAIGACIARLPADQRKLVTDHDAFGYFAKRYGLEVVGAVIPSQTTQAQASAADVTNLTNVIRRERVRAIFPESSLNAKLAHAIARETGAKSGATLYGDTLGPKDSRGGTYLTMEAANAESIASALGGDRVRCAIPAT